MGTKIEHKEEQAYMHKCPLQNLVKEPSNWLYFLIKTKKKNNRWRIAKYFVIVRLKGSNNSNCKNHVVKPFFVLLDHEIALWKYNNSYGSSP